MSDCTKIQEDLAAFAEGLLPEEERRAVEQHIRSCPDCRKALSELESVGQLVKGLEEVEPPPGFTFRVMSEIREREASRKRLFERFFRPFSVKIPIHAIATVLIAVAVFYVYRTTEPERALPPLPAVETERPLAAPRSEKKEITEKPTAPAMESRQTNGKDTATPAAPVTGGVVPQTARGGADGLAEGTAGKPDRAVATQRIRERGMAPEPPSVRLETRPPAAGAPTGNLEGVGKAKEEKSVLMKPNGQGPRAKGRAALPGLDAMSGRVAAAPDLTLVVRDPGAAAGQVEAIVKDLSGRILRRESVQGREVLVIEADRGRIEELLGRVSALGDRKDREPAGPGAKEQPVVTIELLAK